MNSLSLAVDWMAFSVEFSDDSTSIIDGEFELLCPLGYRLEIFPGNNIYKYRAILLADNGSKVLTLLWHPYSGLIKYNLALVEVANEYLYNDSFTWDNMLGLLGEIHEFKFHCMSRFDIAVDFTPNDSELELIYKIGSNEVYINGYSQGSVFWHKITARESFMYSREPHCISHGSKNSSIKWKLYNKTLELIDYDSKGNKFFKKQYIVDNWEQAGIDKNNCWRLEVSVSNAHSFKINGEAISFKHLEYTSLGKVFKWLYLNKYKQRLNEGHMNKNNDRRVWLIPLQAIELSCTGICVKKKEYPDPHESSAEIEQYRGLIRMLSSTTTRCNRKQFELVSNYLVQYEELSNLRGYAYKVLGMSTREYCDKIRCETGSGVFVYDEPRRDILE